MDSSSLKETLSFLIMKTLTIVRHAKSSWETSADDHDRPLNDRGMIAAPRVGSAIAEKGKIPDIIISSTALRAATTAKLIAKEIGIKDSLIQYDEQLYLASIRDYEEVISRLNEEDGIEHVMVVSHNPGSHELCHYLTGDDSIDRFITCAVARIDLDIEFWGQIGSKTGKLIEFFTPHDI